MTTINVHFDNTTGSTIAPARADDLEPLVVAADGDVDRPESDGSAPHPASAGPSVAQASAPLTVLASTLASGAAAFMLSGAYRGTLAYLVCAVGLLIGGLGAWLSFRVSRPALVQWLTLPVALVAGAAFLATDASTGTASFANLVVDAIKRGGLQQPPIPMDPGWRLILLVLFAAMAVGSSALAVATNRPKLSIIIAGPVTMLCGLIQPDSRALLSTIGALVLLVAAMAVSYSAELSGMASLTAGFELRRLARSAVLAGALAGVVVLLAQAGALFPQTDKSVVIPPQKPTQPPPQKDRQLFRVDGALNNRPLRLGVLDSVDSEGSWLFAPYDTSRLVELDMPAELTPSALPGQEVRISIDDIGGHSVPTVAGAQRIEGSSTLLSLDPRTDSLQTITKPAFAGLTYTVTATPVPTGKQLAAAGPAPADYAEFLQAPTVPAEVAALLDSYSALARKQGVPPNAFDRLQYLRSALYRKVVSAGAGKPAPATVTHIVAMLKGAEASPYQISEAEAVLARWAGVPSRIGYGYFGGTVQQDGARAYRPKDGAAWLEVYFQGQGWVPIVGIPPNAKADTSTDQKNTNPAVRATDDLALVVYTPVKDVGLLFFFQYVRYYLVRALGVIAVLGVLWFLYPMALKRIRHQRRISWAAHSDSQAKIVMHYTEFRDRMRDFAIGDSSATPMEFLDYVGEDQEHEELAWLVTRALWGDLARDLQQFDVDAAHDLAVSVGARVSRAHGYPLRVSAAVSRSSLREPYSLEIPNCWPRVRRLRLPSARFPSLARPRLPRRA